MQRYDFFAFLQNFREKKLNIYHCFNIRLRFAAISVGVHIILYRGAARVLRLCSRLPVRPKTASTKRVYTPPPGIATHFLHLHEAALRRNVAYGEGCQSSPMARRRLGHASMTENLMEKKRMPKGSGAKCRSWNGRFADWARRGYGSPDVKLAALIYVKIQVQRYMFHWNRQNSR